MLIRLIGDGIENWQNGLYRSKPFFRKVKRFVRAPEHSFEVIVTPQWRDICRGEIMSLGYSISPAEEREISEKLEKELSSCIVVKGRIWDAYRLCLWLRTASRVVVRIASFEARSPRVFFKKVRAIPWEVWINPLIPLRLYCNVEYSDLRHEGMVCEETVKAICDRFSERGLNLSWERVKVEGSAGESFPEKCRLWVNVFRNICTVKLDLTGAHLHERGYRLEPGYAPLRETLASAILGLLEWKPLEEPLIDAMTGSGTLPIEATLMARNIAPGLKRSFLFEWLPFFDSAPWLHEKKIAEGFIRDLTQAVVAIDKNGDQLNRAKRNAERAGVINDIRWINEDFFTTKPELLGINKRGVLFINPPYGKRLDVDTRRFFVRLIRHIKDRYAGWKVGLLVPEDKLISLLNNLSPSILRIPHGGLWVNLAIFKLPRSP